MLPTLNLTGDVLLVERVSPLLGKVGPGDVVLVRSVDNPRKLITKRIMGMEGDFAKNSFDPWSPSQIQSCFAYCIFIILEALLLIIRCWILFYFPLYGFPYQLPSYFMSRAVSFDWFTHQASNLASNLPEPGLSDRSVTVKVPKGHVWLQGDNIYASKDSRQLGPFPYGLIMGKVFYRVWPPEGFGSLGRQEL
ncbi:unnamed protein product [Cuscuta campestris]|uniref:Peptidase S26 domain-containing protein n=1 Tax=Cuscuta campestris TaxID=132261 RepID=A0A484LVM1_9ASTE|nr:unnamed protein product [Cuscuta campestris]